jgi:hypothetical protein
MILVQDQEASSAPKKRQNPVLSGGIFILLVVPLALPQSNIALYWRVLGLTLLGLGVLYTFFFKSALSSVVLAASFASLFEAPLKYLTDNKLETTTAYLGRDLLIYSLILALSLNLLLKFIQGDLAGKAPPAMFLVVCFLLNLIVQIFNPDAYTPLASFLNSRIFWEMLPLYFIGFYYLRTIKDWKIIFATFAVLTTVNGVVAVYQSSVGPDVIGAWGPGYKTQIFDRQRTVLTSDNQLTFRPFGLGTDMGFSGYLGVVTIPMLTALLATGEQRRTQSGLVSNLRQLLNVALISTLVAGTFAAVIISGSRTIVLSSVLLAGASLLFSFWKASKVRLIIGTGISIALALAALQLVTIFAPYFAERYTSINSTEKTVETFNSEGRIVQITEIPIGIALRHPFGAGLDNLGPGASFSNTLAGTPTRPLVENAENMLNLTLLGLGLPGLAIFALLHLRFARLCWQAIQSVPDKDAKALMGGGWLLILFFLPNWLFGGWIVFPFNMLFWLMPGMILGTADEYRKKRTLEALE